MQLISILRPVTRLAPYILCSICHLDNRLYMVLSLDGERHGHLFQILLALCQRRMGGLGRKSQRVGQYSWSNHYMEYSLGMGVSNETPRDIRHVIRHVIFCF
jgi:hypothetical protein